MYSEISMRLRVIGIALKTITKVSLPPTHMDNLEASTVDTSTFDSRQSQHILACFLINNMSTDESFHVLRANLASVQAKPVAMAFPSESAAPFW